MEIITPPSYLIPVFAAGDFEGLLQKSAEAAATLLGEDLAGDLSLVLLEGGGPQGWLLNRLTLHQHRIFRPCRVREEELGDPSDFTGVRLFPGGPGRLIAAGEEDLGGAADQVSQTLCVRLGQGETRVGWLMLPIRESAGNLGLETEEGLVQLAQALGRIAPRVLLHERTAAQNQQLRHLHEAMARNLVALNKSSLLASLLLILNRHFGLARVIIAGINQETQTLRGELHSGFGPSFLPLTISLDQTDHPLIQALAQGDVLIQEGLGGGWAASLGDMAAMRVERCVLLPLTIGMRPVGLIYADQPAHDGTPYFHAVFEAFARLAAAALESLYLRVRAEQRAETDALTGLYNRHFLNQILELEIPRVKRYNHSISLLMLDLCDFKHFNDTYGHQFGDFILRETASLLQANVRRPDIVVRYGGDEFVVLMVNTTHEQALQVKARIERAFIERNRMQHDERTTIKISIGLRSADASTIEGLLHQADMEMYAHKAHQTRLQLITGLLAANIEKIEAADRVVGSLCNILYKKAPYYPQHARRVAHLALLLARRLGLPDGEVETVVLAALLHDVGKVSIPTEILQKTEPLSAAEMAAVRHHPALGEEFFQGLEPLEPVRPIIRSHHERYDGQVCGEFPGYPDGVCGERIPLAARILKLAESVECMLYGLPYRAAEPPEVVARIVREEAGKAFDPHLVNILLADKNWHQDLGETDRIADLLNLEV